MNKFFVIFGNTYMNKIKSKSFIITTLVIAVLIVGLTNLERMIDFFEKRSGPTEIAVIDDSNILFEPLQAQLQLIKEDLLLISYEGTKEEAEAKIVEGQLDGLVVLSLNDEGLPEAVYKANLVAEQRVPGQLEHALQQIKMTLATESIGIAPNDLEKLYAPVPFERVALTEGAKTEEELYQARMLVNILVFVIYFSVLIYGNMIAMEVAIEKSSRVMEILISSVSPVTQMFAKIFAVALLGLTQQAFVLLVAFLSIIQSMPAQQDDSLGGVAGFATLPVMTIVYAVVFFLLGYLLFATLAASLGSLVSRIEDVNQVITPLNLLVILAFLISMFGLQNPESVFITVTSYIPFFTPMIMFLRVGMLALPLWEIVLGIIILVGTIIFFAIIGARIYRGGVLLYGKSSSFKDIKKALILSKKE